VGLTCHFFVIAQFRSKLNLGHYYLHPYFEKLWDNLFKEDVNQMGLSYIMQEIIKIREEEKRLQEEEVEAVYEQYEKQRIEEARNRPFLEKVQDFFYNLIPRKNSNLPDDGLPF
jgi:signal recognition particle GTPase